MPGNIDCLVMACDSEACDFKPLKIQRRALGARDVLIDIKYCGVCHSDLHHAAGHWKSILPPPQFPCVPGHEMTGVVLEVGAEVTKFAVGDHIGVGCMVDSCLECSSCKKGDENWCKKQVGTYGALDMNGRAAQVPAGCQTLGGYAKNIVVFEHFGIKIPNTYPLEKASPILCAGITAYEPLRYHGAKKGSRIGIVGLGGLGVMGVKLAKALGCEVTVISRSMSKAELAKQLGADNYIASSDSEQMAAARKSLDLILDFIPVEHKYTPYVGMLAKKGQIVFLGITPAFGAAHFRGGPKASGCCKCSAIGGIERTQEVMDLCDKAKIYPETTLMPVEKLNEIYEALDGSNESGTRYVLDIERTLTEKAYEACVSPPPKLKPSESNFNMGAIMKEVVYQKFCMRSR